MHEALSGGTKLLALGGGCLVLCAAFLVVLVVAIGAYVRISEEGSKALAK